MTATLRMVVPVAALATALMAHPAESSTYSGTYFFGDSISDTGNNAYLADHLYGPFTSRSLRTPVPIPSPDFVASYPYANDRYSNGPVWAERFAREAGGAAESLFSGGTNYAFGGATMGPLGAGLPPSVRDQIAYYTAGHRASPAALYVIEAGGNDARRAADIAVNGGDPSAIVASYVEDAAASVLALESAGARNILFWYVPDLGRTPEFLLQGPAASAAATRVAIAMNDAINIRAAALSPDELRAVRGFDIFAFMNRVIANPAAYGLSDVTSACAYSATCIADPGRALYWDALHPTAAGHALIASAALASVNPEPEVYILFSLGLAAVGWYHKRARRPTP